MISKKLIYFDNAATSHFKPKVILQSQIKALKKSANPGRSGHKLSIENALKVWDTREVVARHFNLPNSENVIFTKNCTEALNIAILGTVKKGKHIICSCFEHNSVLRSLNHIKKFGVKVSIITPKNNVFITSDDVKSALTTDTYLVCISAVSNVTGCKNDIEPISKLCNENNILFLVDFAQAAGHIKIDMNATKISYLAFAGHKGFLAPQGVGALLVNTKIFPSPLMFGGTGSESANPNQPQNLPEHLESGTLQTPAIIGLNHGIKYVEKHFAKNSKRVQILSQYLLKSLQNIENIELYSHSDNNFGVVSFNLKNFDSNEISDYLDRNYNIAVRSGLHCSPLVHKFLGTTQRGTVRISLCFKNTKSEIKIFIKALKQFLNKKKDSLNLSKRD